MCEIDRQKGIKAAGVTYLRVAITNIDVNPYFLFILEVVTRLKHRLLQLQT